MEQVTQLHRLTNREVDVVTLYRSLQSDEQEFILRMLKAQAEANRQQDNVVRLRLG